jgi:pimeloyl-[acyl-carrier protein] methyl ester esterase
VYIERTGQGPDLVLLHGWAMHGGIFAPLTRALGEHFRVHVVDLPGHGRSPLATDFSLHECVRSVRADTPAAIWAGWSLGGLVALQAALDAPEQVRALGMITANPRFVMGEDWPHGVEPQVFRQFSDGLRGDWKRTLERFLALEAHGSERAKSELRELKSQIFAHGEPQLAALDAGLAILDRCDLRARLAELTRPSLWIGGRRDRLVPAEAMQWSANAARCATYLEVSAGHAPFLSHPDEVVTGLIELSTRL